MANKKISQLTETLTLENNDVVPVAKVGEIETKKFKFSTLLAWIQDNLIGKFNTPTGSTSQYIRGDGTLATLPASVSSVGVTMPSGFNVSGSPVTSSGTIAITGSGDTTQYIAGDGSLITFPVAGQAGTLVTEVRNVSGATMTKGTIVYINGASGNKPTIAKALATSDATSARTLGLLQSDITNNSNGYCVVIGLLAGLNTTSFTEGTQLYLSGITAGTYTSTKTLAPTHLVYIGKVTRSHATQGQIEVGIQNGYELDEIHDVAISSPANNQGILWESSTSLWKNKQIDNIYNADGYLTGNRVVGMNDYYLAFEKDILVNNLTIGKGGYNIDENTAIGYQALYNNSTIYTHYVSGYADACGDHTDGYYNNINLGNGVIVFLWYMFGMIFDLQVTSAPTNLDLNFTGYIPSSLIGGSCDIEVYISSTGASGVSDVALGYQALFNNTTGKRNIAIGDSALYTNNLGIDNISIGYKASYSSNTQSRNISIGSLTLFNNISGDNNVALGDSVLTSSTFGYNNTAIGGSAMLSNTTGGQNVAIGSQAMYANTTGNYNTALGSSSLRTNTQGGNNTAVGYYSLNSNTTAWYNTALGVYSLHYNQTGYYNTAVGYEAGKNITGNSQTAFGYQALRTNGTGQLNTAIGFQALFTNNTGSYNTALGTQALYFNTSSFNTALGYQSLYNSTTGGYNTAVGYAALTSNTTGYENNAFGYQALKSNTTGYGNDAISRNALLNNTTGFYNCAFGSSTLQNNTTGNTNIAIGGAASQFNTTGNLNTTIGNQALLANTTGSSNIAIGYRAARYKNGTTNLSVSDNSIFIGNLSKALGENQTNQIVIGDSAIGAGSNSVVIGNDSIAKTLLKGDVGIGMSPSFKLDVNGFLRATGYISSLGNAGLTETINILDGNGLVNIFGFENGILVAYTQS